MSTEVLATCKRYGFELSVYTNRIEVSEVGFAGKKKQTVVLLRSVASIEMDRLKIHLNVKTNDGTKYSWVTAPNTEELYNALIPLL